MKSKAFIRKILSTLLCMIIVISPFCGILAKVSFLEDYEAIENVSKSILYIETDDNYDDEYYTSGTGFVAFDNKTFVTNYHVIEGAVRITVYDEDYREYEVGNILVVDKERDIAIISFKSATRLDPLVLASNPQIKRGQPVATIGYPKGLFSTFSTGIISAILDFDNRREIQFTAPISHGSSGGVLLNANGEVIGITTSLIEDGQNINFAVDISHVIKLYSKHNTNYLTYWPTATSTPNATLRPTNTPTPTASPIPTEKLKLPAPTNLSFTIKDNYIEIIWTSVPGAIQYWVSRSSSMLGQYSFIGMTPKTTFKDYSVLASIEYYYKVACVDGKANLHNPSEYIKAIYSTPIPTLTPTRKPTPTPTPALISYITSEEIAKYKTLKAGMNDPDIARLKERMYELGYFNNRTVNNNFTETTAEYVKEFQRANGLKADGIASPEMQALFFSKYALPKPSPSPKPSPTPSSTPRLSQPTNVKASVKETTVTVTWNAVKGADEYRVYRSTGPNSYFSSIGISKTNEFSDSKTVRGRTYYYKVDSVSGNNISILSTYAKAVMPKPTPTPYVEPKYPLQIGDYAYWDYYNDYISFNPKVTNVSKRSTIDGFTLTYYFENIFDEKIKSYGFGSYYINITYTKTIKPNSSIYVGYTKFPEFSGVRYVRVAVTKIHTKDGRTITIPEKDWNYNYWIID